MTFPLSAFTLFIYISHLLFIQKIQCSTFNAFFLLSSPQQQPREVIWAQRDDWPKVTQLAFMAEAAFELTISAFSSLEPWPLDQTSSPEMIDTQTLGLVVSSAVLKFWCWSWTFVRNNGSWSEYGKVGSYYDSANSCCGHLGFNKCIEVILGIQRLAYQHFKIQFQRIFQSKLLFVLDSGKCSNCKCTDGSGVMHSNP